MKQFYVLSLMALLAMQSAGLLVFFSIKQNAVRYKMQRLTKEEAAREKIKPYVFSLTDFDVVKRDGGKEFSIGGWMFDITDREIKGDSIYLLAFKDHEESKLLRWFGNLYRRSGTKDPEATKAAFLYALFQPLLNADCGFYFSPKVTAEEVSYYNLSKRLTDSFFNSFFQPPE